MTRHLLVIGAQRCGTTYLHALLDAHPEITMARPARPEPKVFLLRRARRPRRRVVPRDLLRATPTDEQLLGEKSTSYLEDPRGRRAGREVLGDPHVLVLLRDPVAAGGLQLAVQHRQRPGDPAPGDGAAREPGRGRPPWDPSVTSVSPFAYLERGRYVDYLAPWLDGVRRRGARARSWRSCVGDDAALARASTPAWASTPASARAAATRPVNAERRSPRPTSTADLTGRLEGYFAASNQALSDAARARPALVEPIRRASTTACESTCSTARPARASRSTSRRRGPGAGLRPGARSAAGTRPPAARSRPRRRRCSPSRPAPRRCC